MPHKKKCIRTGAVVKDYLLSWWVCKYQALCCFNDEEKDGVDEEAVGNFTEVAEEEEDTSICGTINFIDHLRVGGEVESTDF